MNINVMKIVVTIFLIVTNFDSSADAITYNYEGTLTSVADPDGILNVTGMTPISSTFNGSFTYDTVPLTNLPISDPADTRYDLTSFELTIDDTYFFITSGGTIALNDNTNTWGDLVNVIGDRNVATWNLPDIDLILPQLIFSDLTKTLFDQGIIMPTPLQIDDFDSAELVFQAHQDGKTTAWVNGVITSITPVPVPHAIWLFGSGLTGLVGIARRKAQT